MDEFITLLHDLLVNAQKYAEKDFRHPSHRDHAEGIADGLQIAYDLLSQCIAKDLTRTKP